MHHQKVIHSVLAILTALLVTSHTSFAQQRMHGHSGDFDLARRFGAGIQMNVLNLGIGPSVDYWITENLGLTATVGAMFDFTSVAIRGNYLLNHTFYPAGYPARPYFGVGFASVKADYDAASIEQKGSGLEVYGGLLLPATHVMKNLYFRGELILSTLKLETTGTTTYGDTVKIENDWGFFSFGAGITYYF